MTWLEFWTVLGSLGSVMASVAAAVSLFLVARQISEAKKATYAQAFIAASERLQEESARVDRGATYRLQDKPFAQWTEVEVETARRVVQLLDLVALMVHEGMLPKGVIVENWGPVYYRTWRCTRDLVAHARERSGDPAAFRRFEAVAVEATHNFESRKGPAVNLPPWKR